MIELAEVIRGLRDELERAIAAGDGEALRFEVGPIELEVSVVVEVAAQAGAKVRFWVVDVGVQGNASQAVTQRIKLVLAPQVGEHRTTPRVSGTAGDRER